MAATYRVQCSPTWGANKNMLAIYNGAGSGKIVRVYRIWALNNYVSAISGIMQRITIGRFSGAYTGGTGLTFLKMDSASAAAPAQVVTAHNCTGVAITAVFKRFNWSSDEMAVAAITLDELECFPALTCVWDSGYGDSGIEPITLRETEGVTLQTVNDGTSASSVDISAELTIV